MKRGFGLYVHWPFCQAKCPYCDFNSHVWNTVDQRVWRSAFQSEIARVRDEFPDRTLTSIYFGGGTPSLMEPETVDTLLTAARAAWPMANDVEITLEANPTSVEAGRFQGYAAAGVNRVSIGIQALDDPALRSLGRLHSVAEARAAFDTARNIFPRVSFDLIYARQHQSLTEWEAELDIALSMAADHLSLYQLTVESGTAFGDRLARGRLNGLPGEDLSADMFALTQDMTEAGGLPCYEISNHATPGGESRHNLLYWRSHDWSAIGPGAHGRYTVDDTRIATEAHDMPADWLGAIQSAGSGERVLRRLNPLEAKEEAILMGLRLREGIPEALVHEYSCKINNLIDGGLLLREHGTIHASDHGRPLLNAILRHLLT